MPASQLKTEEAILTTAAAVERPVWVRYAMLTGVVVSLAFLAVAIFRTRNWPFVHDAPLMHYIVFLMSHGFAPYRDILDMNMPGSYMLEAFGMKVFGPGATGWLLFEFASMAVLFASSIWIAGPKRQMAGILAASLTCLFKLGDGPSQLVQRDWIVAILLVLAFGCLMEFLRAGHDSWIAGILFCSGLAATIKPPALLLPFFVLIGLFAIHRRSVSKLGSILMWSFAGMLVPAGAVLLFLAKWHDGAAFVGILKGLVPYYAAIFKMPVRVLLDIFFHRLRFLLLPAAILFVWNRAATGARAIKGDTEGTARAIEQLFLVAACLCGLMLFLIQGKGFAYHIYPTVPFLALLVTLEMDEAIGTQGARSWFAAATLALVAALMPLRMIQTEALTSYPMKTINSLEADLTRLGGTQLSGHVQCLDMTMGGCINVLYRLQIVQSTGFIYDYYLFPAHGTALTSSMQARFYDAVSSNPPQVFILSSHTWPEETQSYDKVGNWPLFQSFLADHYTMTEEHVLEPGDGAGYRIYQLLPVAGQTAK